MASKRVLQSVCIVALTFTPLISDAQNSFSLTACGDRYIVFDRFLNNKIELWRADSDGSNPIKLADDPRESQCFQDGTAVIFFNPDKLARIPIEGGTPTAIPNIAPADIGAFRLSPDGKSIALSYEEGRPVPTDKFAIVPIGGGALTNVMQAPPQYTLWIYDFDAGTLRPVLSADAGMMIVEPVIGQIKQARGFRQFLLRGFEKVQGEWSLVCTTHNILKLYRLCR